MNYWLIIGIVAVSWIVTVIIGIWFNHASKNKIMTENSSMGLFAINRTPEFQKAVVDQANNTLFFWSWNNCWNFCGRITRCYC
jgi:hypothetical protein